MAPKKKGQKMALTDFFNEGPSVSNWADDDDFSLPSAPAPKDPSAPKRGDPGYLDSMPDRGARGSNFGGATSSRADVPFPTAPPYTAFVGGLAFETTDSELLDFFTDLKPTTSRLVKDATGKSKGFGYVEFEQADGLRGALDKSGMQLGGRVIRLSVAEAPSSRREFTPSAAEESSQWRRSGPLPAREASGPPSGRRSFASPGGEDRGSREPEAERDWGSARGAKFVPSSQQTPPLGSGGGGFRRETSGGGFRREDAPHAHANAHAPLTPSIADDASAWRSSKPLVEAQAQAQAGAARGEREVSTPGLADTESTWSRGTKLRTPGPASAATSTPASPAGASSEPRPSESEWRRPAVSRNGSQDEKPSAPAAPTERRKLHLTPRLGGPNGSTTASTTTSATGASTPENASSPRSSIFGGAKPIDSAAKEAAAADKLAVQEKERKAAAAKARQEEEGKAKALSDEKERMIKEAQESALREAGVAVPQTSHTQQGQGQGRKSSQGQSQGQQPPTGPRSNASGANANANRSQQGQSRVNSNSNPNAQAAPPPTRNAWGVARGAGGPGAGGAGAGRGGAHAHGGPTRQASGDRQQRQPQHQQQQQQQQQPQRKREPVEKIIDEDGFEVAGSRGARSQPQAQAQAQQGQGKEQGQGQGKPAAKGFSFSKTGFGDDGEAEGDTGGEGVEGVTKGVEGVQV